MKSAPGTKATVKKGWWLSYRYLVLRRISQLLIIVLFLLGPVAGIWVFHGNLSSSLFLDTIPLTDPFALLQSLATLAVPAATALMGASIIILLYAIIGGRVFCSWVCPINPITDLAFWLRQKLKLRASAQLSRHTRYGLLFASLLASFITGTLAWELVNPVSMLHRGLIFGMGSGWFLILTIFLMDLFLIERGWCGHLCPMGAAYGLIGKFKLLQVTVAQPENCNNCLDCYAVCPERHVLKEPLKAADGEVAPIHSVDCSNCMRCIDVCAEDVFKISTRFANSAEKQK